MTVIAKLKLRPHSLCDANVAAGDGAGNQQRASQQYALRSRASNIQIILRRSNIDVELVQSKRRCILNTDKEEENETYTCTEAAPSVRSAKCMEMLARCLSDSDIIVLDAFD